MSIVAELSVAPVIEGSMSEQIAKAVQALEGFDVEYETHPMGTVIEAESLDELFNAVKAAHKAVEADRVSTFLKIDDKRNRSTRARDKVRSVERALGRPARSEESGEK